MLAVCLVIVNDYFDGPVKVPKADLFERQCELIPVGVQVIVNVLGSINRVPFGSEKRQRGKKIMRLQLVTEASTSVTYHRTTPAAWSAFLREISKKGSDLPSPITPGSIFFMSKPRRCNVAYPVACPRKLSSTLTTILHIEYRHQNEKRTILEG